MSQILLVLLLPQRNTKWIRRDYRLPLPPPLRPSSSSSSSPSCHSLLRIPMSILATDVCQFHWLWIQIFSVFGWQIGSNALPSDRCSQVAQCIMGRKVRLITLWPSKLKWVTLTWHQTLPWRLNKHRKTIIIFVDSRWFERSVKEARADCGHCPLSNPQSDSSDPWPLIPARPAHRVHDS